VIASPEAANGASYALVKDVSFRDGLIEVDLTGNLRRVRLPGRAGFISIAFWIQADGRYEHIYLRPTNGRADDQIGRNHSTQSESRARRGIQRSVSAQSFHYQDAHSRHTAGRTKGD
jgi:hypothetical protein